MEFNILTDNYKEELKKRSDFSKLLLPFVYNYFDKQARIFEFQDKKQMQEKLRSIKEKAIDNIFELKKTAINNFRKNGITVFEAKNISQAKEFISKITKSDDLIVKSKSNAANEINLKEILKGKKLLETDIGDFIVSLAKEREVHPVLPALSLSPEDIADVIKEKFGVEIPSYPENIVEFIRNLLREKINKADCGITGANVLTATGEAIILENEGNISLITRIPKKHIIISGYEKIVPSLEEAMHVVKCSAVFGTGQNFPSYVNIISAPSKTADIQNQLVEGAQGAKEVYLILLDCGRTDLINKGYKELLYCINCGACLNFCPVYHQLGNNQKINYKGISNTIKEYFFSKNENLINKSNLCTLCKTCSGNCPAKINLPKLMRKLREEVNLSGGNSANKKMIENIRNFGNPFGNLKFGEKPTDLYCC